MAENDVEITTEERNGKKIYKAVKDGDVVGQVKVLPDKKTPGQGFIQNLNVDAGQREKGIGGRLVDKATQDSQFTEIRTEIALDNHISVFMHWIRGFRYESSKFDQQGKEYGIYVFRK